MGVASVERECAHWERSGDRVLCTLCPLNCRIGEGRAGACRVRVNEGARLVASTYGRVSSVHMDPIEKKPLFHFYPGAAILSLGSLGCNLSCRFCQNWTISQEMSQTRTLGAAEAVELAAGERGNIGIAFTYNEPVIWFEYVTETAALARERGLKNVLVTNGFANPEPWRELLKHVDAVNIDVKAMRPEFYRRICRGKMEPVLENVRSAREAGCWVEVTNLVVTNHNDTEDDFARLADWLASVDPDIPLHLSRYHPDYRMTDPATPLETLERAAEIARRKLRYVYVGNVAGGTGEDTVCPGCGAVVIRRAGYSVVKAEVRGGKCAACGQKLAMVGA